MKKCANKLTGKGGKGIPMKGPASMVCCCWLINHLSSNQMQFSMGMAPLKVSLTDSNFENLADWRKQFLILMMMMKKKNSTSQKISLLENLANEYFLFLVVHHSLVIVSELY